MNEAGPGEPAVIPGKIFAEDVLTPPDMEFDVNIRQALKVSNNDMYYHMFFLKNKNVVFMLLP